MHKENYQRWLNQTNLDQDTINELKAIRNNEEEIEGRFRKDIDFGTNGIRGLMGVGSSRMNIYTVRKVSQGIANYLKATYEDEEISLVIAFDSRHKSHTFAKEAAGVMAANGLRVYIFDSIRSSPQLSCAVRYLGCQLGIMMTASHNPAVYNGYKVYGQDGGILAAGPTEAVTAYIKRVDIFDQVTYKAYDQALEDQEVLVLGPEVDRNYMDHVRTLLVDKPLRERPFKTVYTPLFGGGLVPVQKIWTEKAEDIVYVDHQCPPNGDFPGMDAPNPEYKKTMGEAIRLAQETGAHLVIGTDPDVDRVGVGVRRPGGDFDLLTGNQIGLLLLEYVLDHTENLSKKDIVMTTIVSSDLGIEIAQAYGVSHFRTLTGFKNIGEKINEYQADKSFDFLFGYEESLGYLKGTFTREKDAIVACLLVHEMAQAYWQEGKSLFDQLELIYEKYGYNIDGAKTYEFKGLYFNERMAKKVDDLRDKVYLKQVFPEIMTLEDYKAQEAYNFQTQDVKALNLPSSNVLKIYLINGSWIGIRPSGTEPKMKIYFSARGKTREEAEMYLDTMKVAVDGIFNDTK